MKAPCIDLNASSFDGLPWPHLVKGRLIRRYRRFLADVRLSDGRKVTAHCPNTGSMEGCSEPGRDVFLSVHDRPERKLKYTWELIRMPTSLVGINTAIPNRLVFEALRHRTIHGFKGYDQVQSEVRIGNASRIDMVLTKGTTGTTKQCYVEIKNCTLVENGTAQFPDAVTLRGRKHLEELQKLAAAGNRCVMFYLVQRMDAKRFRPATHIDPDYTRELQRAIQNGIQILAFDVHIDLKRITLRRRLNARIDGV